MKTQFSSLPRARQIQSGSAVLVVLAVLTILLMLLAANTATLNWLRKEVNAVDKRQTQRLSVSLTSPLHRAGSLTNQPPSK